MNKRTILPASLIVLCIALSGWAIVKLHDLSSVLMPAQTLPLTLITIASMVVTLGACVMLIRSGTEAAGWQDLIGETNRLLKADLKDVVGIEATKISVKAAFQRIISELRFELSDARRRQKLLIDRAVDVICVIDGNGRIMSINPACEKAWGYKKKELTGQSLAMVLEAAEADRVLKSVLQAPSSIDAVVFESRVVHRSGTLLDVVWTGHWSATEGGLFCIVHDISQQKLVEKTIRQSEQRLHSMLESLPTAVFLAAGSGKIEFVNQAACRLLDRQMTALVSLNVSDVLPSAQVTNSYGGTTTQVVDRSGTTFPVELWTSALETADGSKMLYVCLDKTAEHELARMKRDFTAMIAHDLRTPLTSIQGVLDLLESGMFGELPNQAMDKTAHTRKEFSRVVRLLNDMLQVEKIDTESFDLQCAETKLHVVIKDTIAGMRASAEAKGIKIAESLQESVCWADEERLVQVLINLLSNAIKYAPEHSTITVSLASNSSLAQVKVSDQGRGIPPEKLDKIFQKYEQVDIADSRERGGFGLGLAICQAIVKKHGGSIGVESKIGEGSTFWFVIPIMQNQPQA